MWQQSQLCLQLLDQHFGDTLFTLEYHDPLYLENTKWEDVSVSHPQIDVNYMKGKLVQVQGKVVETDDQIKLFFLILFIIILLTTIWLTANQSIDIIVAFRIALFNITSILTGTGYTSSDFSNWGSFGIVIMMIIMFVGGCAGSTTGGIKIFRLQILFRGAITQIRKLTQPHAVFVMRFNGKTVNENTYNSIMGFFFMYIFLFILSAVSLSLFNLDFLTAFSAAASAISNVGPGLGEIIGPSGNYFLLDNYEQRWWQVSLVKQFCLY